MYPRPLIRKLLLAAATAAGALSASPASADNSLGVAGDYNVFVLNNPAQSDASAANYLTTHSTYWGSLDPTDTAVRSRNGNLTLTGTDPSLNVFAFPAAVLARATGLRISAPAGSTVLVNVLGTTVNVPSIGIDLAGGVDKQHVLFNFPAATSVQFDPVAFPGSVLAPLADVDCRNGTIDGTLIARNLTGPGTGAVYDVRFAGTLPTAVPFSAVAVSAAIFLSGLALSRFRQRHRHE